MTRLRDFLILPELPLRPEPNPAKPPKSLILPLGDIRWEPERKEPTLHACGLKVEPGALVAVVGAVGAGKSTLLHACMAELNPTVCGNSIEEAGRAEVTDPLIAFAILFDPILFGF